MSESHEGPREGESQAHLPALDPREERGPKHVLFEVGIVAGLGLGVFISIGLLVAAFSAPEPLATMDSLVPGAIGAAGIIGLVALLVVNLICGWRLFTYPGPARKPELRREGRPTFKQGIRGVCLLMTATALVVAAISAPRLWLGPTEGPDLTGSQARLIITAEPLARDHALGWRPPGPEAPWVDTPERDHPCGAVRDGERSMLGARLATREGGGAIEGMVYHRYSSARDARDGYRTKVEQARDCESARITRDWGTMDVLGHSSKVPLWVSMNTSFAGLTWPVLIMQYGNLVVTVDGGWPKGTDVGDIAQVIREAIDWAATQPSGSINSGPDADETPQPPANEPPPQQQPNEPPDVDTPESTDKPGHEEQEVVGGFQSPSGNIVCYFLYSDSTDVSVGCGIYQREWDNLPPKPASCPDHRWGAEIRMDFGETPRMICAEESDGPSDWPVLEYGESQEIGPMRCDSQETGVACQDTNGPHAFFMSSETYEMT